MEFGIAIANAVIITTRVRGSFPVNHNLCDLVLMQPNVQPQKL